MNVFLIVNIFSLSEHIQLIHWYFLYPQIEGKIEISLMFEFEIPFEKNILWALKYRRHMAHKHLT